MSSVTKDAAKDAAEYAAAQMSYGEGAGTRRKLIESAVAYKIERIPGYFQAFENSMHTQDITKHVKNAKRSRKTKDIGAVTSKNIKAIFWELDFIYLFFNHLLLNYTTFNKIIPVQYYEPSL